MRTLSGSLHAVCQRAKVAANARAHERTIRAFAAALARSEQAPAVAAGGLQAGSTDRDGCGGAVPDTGRRLLREHARAAI